MTPLTQFEIFVFKPLYFFDLSVNNFTIFMFIGFSLIFFVLYFPLRKPSYLSSSWQLLVETTFDFLLSVFKSQVRENKGLNYFPVVYTIFLFLLISNLIGLMPFGFATTSHFIFTFFLAFSFNLSFFFLGFFRSPTLFLKIFVPSGISRFLLPLVVTIEVVSYLLRTLSLSIRLFANMMAGHTLLFILASFSITLLNFSFFFALVPFFLVLAVVVLEFGIAFLQSYVFTVLLCIYLNDSLNPGHLKKKRIVKPVI